ncbi:MAG: hypothetical protein RJA77_922 [Pseudomonadota bacterium]|jgi:diguanylate cyclase (GGDEF)-like protein
MGPDALLYSLAALTLLTHAAGVLLTLSVAHKTSRHRRLWLILTVCPLLLIAHGLLEINSPNFASTHVVLQATFSLVIAAILTLAVLLLRVLLKDLNDKSAVLENRSRIDNLTGLLQREAWVTSVEREIETASRDGSVLSIMEIDVDHFKQVNDTFGHGVGDDTLMHLAALCKAAVRETDLWGRLGGEEFVCAMPHTDISLAVEIAERLRASVEHQSCVFGSKAITITISIGLTSLRPSDHLAIDKRTLIKDLVREADDAMYVAKQSGRNRCCVFSRETQH